MPRICIVYFDAGGGHRNACNAVRDLLAPTRPDWEVEALNLQESLDRLDPLQRLTRIRLQDYYNLMLERGWTLAARPALSALHATIRAYHIPMERMLRGIWTERRPDLVLSVIPNFNRVLGSSLRKTLPNVPFVTLLTDMADYPPHFWIERESQYLICGSERAVRQAMELGHTRERIFQTSGMVLHPRFYNARSSDPAEARVKLGLDPDVTTAVVLFGGYGSNVMYEIAQRLDRCERQLQLVMICGRNQALATRLREMPKRKKMVIEGFTSEVPRYLALADFFIGKPGPGSISEALHFGLPVIVEKNTHTLPQERFNAEWVASEGMGICLRSFHDIASAVEGLLATGVLERYQAAARATSNRAIFEIPEILAAILGCHQTSHVPDASEKWSSVSL